MLELWFAKCVNAVAASDASWDVIWLFETNDDNKFALGGREDKDIVFRDSVMGAVSGHRWDTSRRNCFISSETLEWFKSQMGDYIAHPREVVNSYEPLSPPLKGPRLTTEQLLEQLQATNSIAIEVSKATVVHPLRMHSLSMSFMDMDIYCHC